MSSQEKVKEEWKEIIIGEDKVEISDSTKLLGVTIDSDQKWSTHFSSLISALNKRTFMIRRISNQIPKKKVLNVVHSLWMSRLRYGLQLCNKVKVQEEDKTSQNMKSVQIAMNKMVRMLDGVSLKEHITSESLLKKYMLPSVNQLSAEIKMVEAWKIMNIPDYPLTFEQNSPNKVQTERPTSIKQWKDSANLKIAQESFTIDAARLWNLAPTDIKQAESLQKAKTNIKKWCSQIYL